MNKYTVDLVIRVFKLSRICDFLTFCEVYNSRTIDFGGKLGSSAIQ